MEHNKVRICVPVCVQRARELLPAVARAAEVGDIVELRLDCLPESELAVAGSELSDAFIRWPCPVILTLRPAEFGGYRPISSADRLYFRIHEFRFHRGSRLEPDFWDLEYDLALLLQRREKEGNDVGGLNVCDWDRTVCSYHDFVGVPSDVDKIYKLMAATPAQVLKLAVQADDATDCLALFRLLETARRGGREMIAIAMGDAGMATRILGPSRGAFLTYGALDEGSATAPGQITARELREVYHIDRISQHTKIFGLMGRPVVHSISPQIQNAAFADAKINAVYIPFEVRDAKAFIRRMLRPRTREIDWELRGLSVTAPHKIAVIPHLDWIEPLAKEIGAVNTIVVHEDELRGYNTDAEAFIRPLRRAFGSLKGARCAIIGAGGAALSALWVLRREGARVNLFARNSERGQQLARTFAVDCYPLAGADFHRTEIVVNATPLGTRGEGETETPAVASQLRGVRLVYDLVYNPVETEFMRQAGAAGCEALGGLEMLLAQAAEQFRLWTGVEPNIEVMRAAANAYCRKMVCSLVR